MHAHQAVLFLFLSSIMMSGWLSTLMLRQSRDGYHSSYNEFRELTENNFLSSGSRGASKRLYE